MLSAGVSIALLGMAVVFIFLILLVLIILLTSRILSSRTTAELAIITAESKRQALRRAIPDADERRLVAVITAAIALDRQFRSGAV